MAPIKINILDHLQMIKSINQAGQSAVSTVQKLMELKRRKQGTFKCEMCQEERPFAEKSIKSNVCDSCIEDCVKAQAECHKWYPPEVIADVMQNHGLAPIRNFENKFVGTKKIV